MGTQTNGELIVMKRLCIYILSILGLVACSKEQETITNYNVNYSPKFYAEIDNTLTRTYVNDALKVCWNENDKLSVFTSTENQLYKFDGNTGDLVGTFSKVESYSSSTGASLSVDANYAVYPHSEETTISSDGTLTLVLPQNQVYVKNSFGVNSNPMIAVTENRNDTYLSFKNICGYLRVSLYGDSITAKSIRLEGNSNERISGKANVSISYGQEPIITLADDALHTITLDCQDGVQMGESASDVTEFWFVVPPVTFENGFTLIVEDVNGYKYTKSTENKIEIKRSVVNNMAVSKVDQLMLYEELTYEEDGIDAIVTNDGLFALIEQLPESKNYIFLCGDVNEDKRGCMLIDENGFLKAVDLGDGKANPIMCTSNSLLLLDSLGSIQYKIPYSVLLDDENINTKSTRAADYTQSRIYKAVDLYSSIEDFVEDPIRSNARDLIRWYLEGKFGRKGSIAADIIDIVGDPKDMLAWEKLLNRYEELLFFGNASVIALDAIKINPVSFCLPCEVKGLNLNNDFTKAIDDGVFSTKLLEYSYTLKMFAQCEKQLSSESYIKEKTIDDNGIVNFDFTFQELTSSYSYEPRLTVNLKYEAWISEEDYYLLAGTVPNAPRWTPNSQIFHKGCTFYGITNRLYTGSVSSSVEKVENEKSTSAYVICSFSDVPSGAECVVLVTEQGRDMSLVFPGQPGSDNQKVYLSALTPSTNYTASSRIIYKGRPYDGLKSISFSTPGPSGYIVSIPEEQITTTSAVVKCQYSNIESGVECGVIVKGEDGSSKTVSASNIEGEQNVTISGLKPATQYTCTSYVKLTHSQGAYYREGNSLNFTTEAEPLPDLSGMWTFTQEYYGDKSLTIELILESESKNSASYKAKSGFYGVNSLYLSVSRDGSCYIYTGSTSYAGRFHGTFNEDFTSASGDTFTRENVGPLYTNVTTVEKPWSFSR